MRGESVSVRGAAILAGLVGVALLAFAGPAGAAVQRAPVIVDGPARLTAERAATFAFVVDDPRATTRCRVDAGAWRRCVSPYRTAALGDGRHRFEVIARGRSDRAEWRIDTTPPPAPTITPETPSRFTLGGRRLSCSLDGAAAEPCAGSVEFPGLAPGEHTLTVTARDRAGNASRGEQTWTVTSAPLARTGPSEPGTTTARVTGEVTPGASYHYEYGPTTDYGERTLARTSADGSAPATLIGLRPEQAQHYRLVASVCGGCAEGTARGADETVTTSAVTTYVNPVYGGLADPMVLDDGGTYYAYGTGERFPMARSTDLTNWESIAPAMTARPSWVPQSGGWNPWAPSVLHNEPACPGSACYVMYYTALNTTLEPDVNCIGVAIAASPAGPFTDTGMLDTEPSTRDAAGRPIGCGDDQGHSNIDAAPFVDPATGKAYLYLSTGRDPSRAWRRTISVIELTADRLKAAGPRRPLFTYTQPWEGDVVEGPWMVRRGETYYLFYSGGTFTNATYGLGYAYGASPLGPFVKDVQLLGTIPLVIGPGGASLIGDDLAVYHARAVPEAARTMRIDPVLWGEPPKVTVGGPTTGPQPRPRAAPRGDARE